MSTSTPFALPTGQISLNEMHIEAGGTSGTQCSMNDADIRDMIGKGSGTQAGFNEYHGASNAPTVTYLGGSQQNAGSSNWTFNVNNGTGTADDLIIICFSHEVAADYIAYDEIFTVNGANATKAVFQNAVSAADHQGDGQARVGIWYVSPASQSSIVGDTSLTIAKTTQHTPANGYPHAGKWDPEDGWSRRSAMTVYRVNNGALASLLATKGQYSTGANSMSETNTNTDNTAIIVASHMSNGDSHALSTTNGTMTQHNLIDVSSYGTGMTGFVTGCTGTNTVTLTRANGTATGHDAIASAMWG